jgi:hypothetical protein
MGATLCAAARRQLILFLLLSILWPVADAA